MNCERVQDLILTDYLDGVIDSEMRKDLESHLSACPQCLAFAQTAKQTAFEAFKEVEAVNAPEHVWNRIENAIQDKKQFETSGVLTWLDHIKNVFSLPRPVFVLGVLLVLFVAGGTLQQIKSSQRVLSQSSVDYVVSLVDNSNDFSTTSNGDFGTDVELLFL